MILGIKKANNKKEQYGRNNRKRRAGDLLQSPGHICPLRFDSVSGKLDPLCLFVDRFSASSVF